MNKKNYLYTSLLCLALTAGGCSQEEDPATNDKGTPIEGVFLCMEGMGTETSVTTRSGLSGYSVNTEKDPTKATDLAKRTEWKLDFTLYNSKIAADVKYDDGSFVNGAYDNAKGVWIPPTPSKTYYFPNYHSPKVELLLRPSSWKVGETAIDEDQTSDVLLSQDLLKEKETTITPAHIIVKKGNPITLTHKHAMLNFVIEDIKKDEIDKVTVEVGNFSYKPYEISHETNGAADKGWENKREYMLILSEETSTDPTIKVVTKKGINAPITYLQTVKIITGLNRNKLESNNCYCFTLKGKALEISPVTIADWDTGEAIQEEYIAVTAYPTFVATDHATDTYYFYYDSCLKDERGAPKLQKITFNQHDECTIKPDGRIITHIFKSDATDKTPTNSNELKTPITLGAMVIDLTDIIKAIQ